MNPAARVFLVAAIIACADGLTFAPAVFSARYRTPRRIAASLAIAGVLSVALVAAVAA